MKRSSLRAAVDLPADPPDDGGLKLKSLEFSDLGGVAITFLVVPNTTYIVEASSDLAEWVALSGAHISDADGRLIVEDPEAGDRRFWRVREVD